MENAADSIGSSVFCLSPAPSDLLELVTRNRAVAVQVEAVEGFRSACPFIPRDSAIVVSVQALKRSFQFLLMTPLTPEPARLGEGSGEG
jgi:hypothetical protein